MIKSLSADVKVELIGKITESTRVKEDEKDDSWKALFGAWQSDQTAEKIIEELRTDRFTNRKIEDL
ncbi:MAG: hypothetical protein OEX02_16885 [Cyclobacteriaceae bacterium]|nr:hypothetical protein [Cyclobacteriaceae bacterium]